jgi:hypothetical protein
LGFLKELHLRVFLELPLEAKLSGYAGLLGCMEKERKEIQKSEDEKLMELLPGRQEQASRAWELLRHKPRAPSLPTRKGLRLFW